jgi:hypothetical protein
VDDLQPANILNEAPGDGKCPALQGAGLHGCHGTSILGIELRTLGRFWGGKSWEKVGKNHENP